MKRCTCQFLDRIPNDNEDGPCPCCGAETGSPCRPHTRWDRRAVRAWMLRCRLLQWWRR